MAEKPGPAELAAFWLPISIIRVVTHSATAVPSTGWALEMKNVAQDRFPTLAGLIFHRETNEYIIQAVISAIEKNKLEGEGRSL